MSNTERTVEEIELLRLASLVGTDAKNPEENLLAYIEKRERRRCEEVVERVKELENRIRGYQIDIEVLTQITQPNNPDRPLNQERD